MADWMQASVILHVRAMAFRRQENPYPVSYKNDDADSQTGTRERHELSQPKVQWPCALFR
jgi:hypothetical protein